LAWRIESPGKSRVARKARFQEPSRFAHGTFPKGRTHWTRVVRYLGIARWRVEELPAASTRVTSSAVAPDVRETGS